MAERGRSGLALRSGGSGLSGAWWAIVRIGLRTSARRTMAKHLAKFPASSKHLQHLCVELA